MRIYINKLARSSLILFLGTAISGSLGYVFQILLGRMLGVQEYASLSALLALYALFTTPMGALMMLISRKVSEYIAIKDAGRLANFFRSMYLYGFLAGILFFFIFIFFSNLMQSFLKLNDVKSLYMLGILIALTFFPTVNNAFMQGFQRFTYLSSLGSLSVLLKIIFSSLLIWLGFGVTGAIGGILISYFLVLLIGYVILYRSLDAPNHSRVKSQHLNIASAIPVFVANLAFVMMTQLDIVLVNYYFPEKEAGLYAAASILGKAVMYLPGGIAIAMFPMVAENHSQNKDTDAILFQAIKLTVLLCGSGAIFYYIFGPLIVEILYGKDYIGAGLVLKYFGFAIFPMALVMVAEHYLIAKGKMLFAYIFGIIAPFELLAIYLYHDNLIQVVAIIGISGMVTLIVGSLILWRSVNIPIKNFKFDQNES